MYAPRGRTDESSFDYTDDPQQLATRFGAARLKEALEDEWPILKFDYEESVPREAIQEAILLCALSARAGFLVRPNFF